MLRRKDNLRCRWWIKKPLRRNQMTKNFSRIALITGATSGIGEATARKFVSSGFAVVGNARTKQKLELLEKEFGPLFTGVAGDASDERVIETLFETSRSTYGNNPDIVVVNAGKGLGSSVTGADLERFEEIWKLNVSGALALMKKSALIMVEMQKTNFPEKAADIVVLGSVVGRHISPFSAVYGSTKFALHSLTEGLRREIGPKGVRVTLVEPAVVVSGFQEAAGYTPELVQNFHEKFGPLLDGGDIAEAIAYMVNCPPHVHVSDIMVRSTRQDYP